MPAAPRSASLRWSSGAWSCRGGSLFGGWRRSFFFFQAEDGIRDTSVTGSDVCSSDLAVLIARPAFGPGGEEFVRGKPRHHKHFWVKRATFLCGAAYLSRNACGALIKLMVPRNTA